MNIEKLTNKSKEILNSAHMIAIKNDHANITNLHILSSILENAYDLAKIICNNTGEIKSDVESKLKNLPKIIGSNNNVSLNNEAVKTIILAEDLAKENSDEFVTVEKLFEALAHNQNIKEILQKHGVTEQNVKEAIKKLRSGKKATSQDSESTFDALNKYGRDVTDLAVNGKLDPIIGRDDEIRRAIQVLSRRSKNNPILIGDPGVGKTAIIEGLAQRIISKDIPESFFGTKLIELDIGALIAGAKYRGEFEERLKSVLNEIKESQQNIILFIDEIHLLVGAGKTDGAMDAANLLKPMLARGELHCIGATTLDEYRKYIEKDAALARRFQTLYVKEPSVNDTISILRGIKEKYEVHHGITISDSAIIAAAKLSDRYITDRFLPDKAIDLIDEAASRLKIEISSKPEEIDEIDRKIIQIKIECESLKKEKSQESKDRIISLKEELEQLTSRSLDLTTKWQAEKAKIQKATDVKERLENAKLQLESASRDGNLEMAGELKYSIIPELEKQISAFEESNKGTNILNEVITDADIAIIISRITGIPVDKMLEGEKEKLLKMEEHLKKSVIGQDAALEAVSNAIRRSRAGIQDMTKPLGSFLFLGPTGVGKTELSKSLAEFLFNDRTAMLRIDMSEYMEKHSVARLIGAPPGYVGYDQGGILTEAIRRRPYQVILFDEIEKAHNDVFNILLQVLDDGRLTDSQGHVVDFKNTIIILTSNIGSEFIIKEKDFHESVMKSLSGYFKPEFLNRIDEILIFNKLAKEDMLNIAKIQLLDLVKILENNNINMHYDESLLSYLADKGYDTEYGARPLKRLIQKEVQDKIARGILSETIKDNVHIYVENNEVVVEP